MNVTRYTDADRIRLADRHGNRMEGPVEVDRCDHGRLRSFRWTWPIDGTPEDGAAECGLPMQEV